MNNRVQVISSGKKLFFSQTIRPFSKIDNSFEIVIDNALKFEFVFRDTDPKGKPVLKSEEIKSENKMKIYFENFSSSLGTANTEINRIGTIKGKDIYMSYVVHSIQDIKLCQVSLYE